MFELYFLLISRNSNLGCNTSVHPRLESNILLDSEKLWV